MFELLEIFATALISLSNDMAVYILFGLFFAGILHELIPTTVVEKHLGNDTVGSVVKATLFGVPLPVCSCGVIPLATAIKKSGASKGATLSFLISTRMKRPIGTTLPAPLQCGRCCSISLLNPT
ncbi:MAG: permease [Campylobacterota bacterium]|nr:permease [Campylobacterota bacterium]